jgi:carbamate kinase
LSDKGWRRVVPSPRPVAVLELHAIHALLATGAVVIAGGGGGIPVVREAQGYRGIAAVIDKDRSTALLARDLAASALVIATNVPHVLLDYGSPSERPARHMSVAEASAHLAEGQFPPGSMGPKVEAAIDFARATGRPAHICALTDIEQALAGAAGTAITA